MECKHIKAKILCRCRHELNLCVPIGFVVPEQLQCIPGTPIARPNNNRSDICCPKCRHTLFSTGSELRACIEAEFRRGPRRHSRSGTVVMDVLVVGSDQRRLGDVFR